MGGMGMHTAQGLANTIIVTVQETQPKVPGDYNAIHVSDVDAIIETDIPIPNLPGAEAVNFTQISGTGVAWQRLPKSILSAACDIRALKTSTTNGNLG